jgi:hypothetical protein
VRPILLLEELAEQYTKLNLCMLQESVESKLHIHMSYSQGFFWPAKTVTSTGIHPTAAKP